MNDTGLLQGDWVHAHEEDGAEGRVFRRADRPLPPSRGRMRLSFRADGTATESGPGADDRTGSRASSWSVPSDDMLVLRGTDDKSARRYRIVSLQPDRLVLQGP